MFAPTTRSFSVIQHETCCDRAADVEQPDCDQNRKPKEPRIRLPRKPESSLSNRQSQLQEDLQYYVQRASKRRLLTQQEERRLSLGIFRFRQAFQRLAIQEPDVLQHIIDLITSWQQGRLRIDGLCDMGLNNPALQQFEKRLSTNIRTIRHLQTRLANETSPVKARQLRHKIIRLIEELAIRPRHFENAPVRSRRALGLLGEYRDRCRQMADANLRLVISVARKFCTGTPFLMDMIQEGNCGLLQAVTKFDHRKDIRFSTYATLWIRQAILATLINADRNIRLPTNYRDIDRQLAAAQQTNRLTLKLNRFRVVRQDTQSLDQPTDNGELESTTANILPDHRRLNPTQMAEAREAIQLVRSQIRKLSERERQVISMRYGLKDGVCQTLNEVGRRLNLTRERIRQIEKSALSKLSHHFEQEPQLAMID